MALRARTKRLRALLLLLGALALAGCGPRTGTVSGKVTLDGRPLTEGDHTVTFLGEDGSVTSCAVEPDGGYVLRGVPSGRVRITVHSFPSARQLWIAPAEGGGMKAVGGAAAPAKTGQAGGAPERYKDPEQSPLRYDVRPGSQTFDIELLP
jgi:hypothetical protein